MTRLTFHHGKGGTTAAIIAAIGLLVGACSSDEPTEAVQVTDSAPIHTEPDSTEPSELDSNETPDGTVPLTASARGVTPTQITVGVSLLDFDYLVSQGFYPAGWDDQIAVYEALIDDLNERGGINGRTVVPVFEFYDPIQAVDANRACTALTEDNEVFAVLGGFLGPLAGTEDSCIVGLNETMLVGGEISPEEFSAAVAPWFTFLTATDRSTGILLDLLVDQELTSGQSVFVASHLASAGNEEAVLDALAERGIEVSGSAVMETNDNDPAAQDTELAVLAERIRVEGATAVLTNGNPAAIIRGLGATGLLDGMKIWANDSAGLASIRDQEAAYARGALTWQSQSDAETFASESFQTECVRVVESRIDGYTVADPETLNDTDEDTFSPVLTHCRDLALFVALASAAGPDLTYDAIWDAAASAPFDDFSLPGHDQLSISSGKQDVTDQYRLAEFDPDVGAGGLTPKTELVDIFD